MQKQYITWDSHRGLVHNIINQLESDNWKPDVIVAISRGGLLTATMLSHKLNVKVVCLHVSTRDSNDCESNLWLAEDAMSGKKTLIVDDINDSGATLNWIISDWNSSICKGSKIDWFESVRFATIVNNISSNAKVNYTAIQIDKSTDADKDAWFVFPVENWWE